MCGDPLRDEARRVELNHRCPGRSEVSIRGVKAAAIRVNWPVRIEGPEGNCIDLPKTPRELGVWEP